VASFTVRKTSIFDKNFRKRWILETINYQGRLPETTPITDR
jgi:hypothetical protein